MLNEYRLQETWNRRADKDVKTYKLLWFDGFFPPCTHSVHTIPDVLKTEYLVLNRLIYFYFFLKGRTMLKLLGYVIKGSRKIHKQGLQRKNSNNLIKETSRFPGPSPRCRRKASASWAGWDTYHHESAGAALEIALQTEGYYCLVSWG